MVRSLRCMRWFAGESSICASCSGRNTRSPWQNRRSAANRGRWATVSCRRAHAITPRRRAPWRLSKKLACDIGDDRASARPRSQRHRDLVRRRGQDRPEEQDHSSLGEAWQSSVSAVRPADRIHLYIRRHLPKEGKAVGLILPWCNAGCGQRPATRRVAFAAAPSGAAALQPACGRLRGACAVVGCGERAHVRVLEPIEGCEGWSAEGMRLASPPRTRCIGWWGSTKPRPSFQGKQLLATIDPTTRRDPPALPYGALLAAVQRLAARYSSRKTA